LLEFCEKYELLAFKQKVELWPASVHLCICASSICANTVTIILREAYDKKRVHLKLETEKVCLLEKNAGVIAQ